MERTIRGTCIAARYAVVLLALLGGVAGCAAMGTDQKGEVVKTVWKARDQHVAIEKQDVAPGSAVTANTHPADIPVDRLRSALESIEVHIQGKDKPVSLFNDPELKILSENIHEALASARQDEDVTFAVIGQYPTLLGIFKERKVTTGRVFCQAGQLNIIFGDVLREVKENEDRRLYPLLQGSRNAAASNEWRLAYKPGGEEFATKRSDWAVFPLAGPAAPVVAPAVQNSSTGTKSKATTPALPAKPGTAVKKTPEERLKTLNDLRQKNLIDEEEYRAKRREVLDEL